MSSPSRGAAAGASRYAVARRDGWLARTRSLSLWVAGSAAAASLGLGTAFAHALPGHARQTVTARQAGTQGSGTRGSGTPVTRLGSRPTSAHPGGHQLSRPRQQPASAPAGPSVVSGGS